MADLEIPVVSLEDVYGGKLVAAMDRQHPRDLFDVMQLLAHSPASRFRTRTLPQERLAIAITSMAAAQRAFDVTCEYVRVRRAFGQAVMDVQNTRHKLTDLQADLSVGWAFVDQCLQQHVHGELGSKQASIAKLWCSEMQGRLVDQCLRFFGGYGFMREYDICRLYADARTQRIYGGTSEIMRELIGRSLAAWVISPRPAVPPSPRRRQTQ